MVRSGAALITGKQKQLSILQIAIFWLLNISSTRSTRGFSHIGTRQKLYVRLDDPLERGKESGVVPAEDGHVHRMHLILNHWDIHGWKYISSPGLCRRPYQSCIKKFIFLLIFLLTTEEKERRAGPSNIINNTLEKVLFLNWYYILC